MQKETLLALTQNMDALNKHQEDVANSAGSAKAMLENAYNGSIDAKVQDLKRSFESLYETILNSKTVGSGFDVLTSGVKVFSSIISSLPATLSVVSAMFTIFNTKIRTSMQMFANIITPINALNNKIVQLGERWRASSIANQGYATTLRQSITTMQTAGVSTAGFGVKLAVLNTKIAVAKIGMIALRVATIAMQTAMSVGLSLVITGVITLIDNLIHKNEKLAESNQQYTDSIKTNEETIASTNKLFSQKKNLEEQLNKSNITDKESLDLKTQLVDIEKQIAIALPDSISGYTLEGEAISSNNALIQKQLDLKKEQNSIDAKNIINQSESYDTQSLTKKRLEENMKRFNEAKTNEEKYWQMEVGTDENGDSVNVMANTEGDVFKRMSESLKDVGKQANITKQAILTLLGQGYTLKDIVSQTNLSTNDVSSAMKDLGFTENQVEQSTNGVKVSLTGENKELEKQNKLLTDNSQKQQELIDIKNESEKYSRALSEQQKIVELQKQINESGKLTPQIMQSALEMYPEMGSKVFDLTTLQGYLNDKIGEQQNIQQEAFFNMTKNDSEYFKNSIQNTSEWESFIGTVMTNLSGENADYYKGISDNMQTDLANCKNLNEAKFEIEKATITALAKLWSDYYSATYKAEDGSNFSASQYTSDGKGGYYIPEEDKAKISEYDAKKKSLLAQQKAMEDKLKGIAFTTAPKFTTSDFNKSDSKDSTSKDIQNLESLVDRYLNLNQALNTINSTLSAYEIAMKNAHGQENINYIEKEVVAYKKKQEILSSNIAELKREKSELASTISSKGFNIDDMDRITNYSAQLTALTNQANNMASGTDAQDKAREKAKSDVQDISEAIKKFIEISSSSIPKLDDEWQTLTNTIQDTYKTVQKLVVDAESKITEVIKDELTRRTNAKIDALDKEKKLLDDKNKSDDYADTLQTAQTKVTDYDSKIMEAIKSRDKEAIKSLTQAKQDAMDELNKTIQDHERDVVSNKFDEEKQKLQDNLTDLTKPENMTKLISESMANGFINVNGEVIKLSDAMDNFLKNSVSGVQSLKSEMADLVNIMNDGVSALGNAGMLSNIKTPTLDNSLFNGNVLNTINTTIPNVSANSGSHTITLNTAGMVHIERVDSSNMEELSNMMDSKINYLVREINDNQYSLN